jgi:hypothetical protein
MKFEGNVRVQSEYLIFDIIFFKMAIFMFPYSHPEGSHIVTTCYQTIYACGTELCYNYSVI